MKKAKAGITKKRVATIWLDGCSGCHMSFIDIDERLLALGSEIELVYGPLVDYKEFPKDVDVTLVEGSVSSEEDLHKIKTVRANTKILVSLGDCAVTGNVPSLRNPIGVDAVMERVYLESNLVNAAVPSQIVPKLLPFVSPVHAVVDVDLYVPGCPPSADTIYYFISELLAGRMPDMNTITRFGK
jgi:NAD-reducing hydrogenase small subunit